MKIKEKCRICGCSIEDPSFHPDVGFFEWANPEHTLCNHCKDPKIKDDPLRVARLTTTAKNYRMKKDEIINHLVEKHTPLIPPEKIDFSKRPQNKKGIKRPPMRTPELNNDLGRLGNAFFFTRERILNLSLNAASIRCQAHSSSIKNIEQGTGEIRNLLKYCKGLGLELRLSYQGNNLCVKILRNGEQIYP